MKSKPMLQPQVDLGEVFLEISTTRCTKWILYFDERHKKIGSIPTQLLIHFEYSSILHSLLLLTINTIYVPPQQQIMNTGPNCSITIYFAKFFGNYLFPILKRPHCFCVSGFGYVAVPWLNNLGLILSFWSSLPVIVLR